MFKRIMQRIMKRILKKMLPSRTFILTEEDLLKAEEGIRKANVGKELEENAIALLRLI